MSTPTRVRHYVTETALWIAAAVGLIAIALVICAYLFNTSIILFRTGSMEPTIPAGSAALVREIPASEVAVGDILTVDRPDSMPVTHRVTSIEPGDASNERVITMRGDANVSPDPAPYTITKARVLVGSIPGLANPINQLNNPYVLGGVTLAAALLVGWAFWPRNDPPSKTASESPAPEQDTTDSDTGPRHARCVVGMLAVTVVTLLPISEQAFASPTEHNTAELVEETVTSRYITLTSVYDPSSRLNLAGGTVSAWDIGIDIDAPTAGNARTGLSTSGAFPLQITVLSCATRWDNAPTYEHSASPACAQGHRVVEEELLVTPDEGVLWIDAFAPEHAPWLRLLVELPHGVEVSEADTTGLRVHAQAHGDEVSSGPGHSPSDGAPQIDDSGPTLAPPGSPSPANLARTGLPALLLLAVAAGAIALGRWFQKRSLKHTRASGGDNS